MKTIAKIGLPLVALLTLALLVCPPAYADGQARVVATPSAIMRVNATAASARVTTVPYGQTVKLLEQNVAGQELTIPGYPTSNLWHKVEWRGYTGYIWGLLLEVQGGSAATIPATPPTLYPWPKPYCLKIIATDEVVQLLAGEPEYREGGNWTRIRRDGREETIVLDWRNLTDRDAKGNKVDYCSQMTAAAAPAPTAIPKPAADVEKPAAPASPITRSGMGLGPIATLVIGGLALLGFFAFWLFNRPWVRARLAFWSTSDVIHPTLPAEPATTTPTASPTAKAKPAATATAASTMPKPATSAEAQKLVDKAQKAYDELVAKRTDLNKQFAVARDTLKQAQKWLAELIEAEQAAEVALRVAEEKAAAEAEAQRLAAEQAAARDLSMKHVPLGTPVNPDLVRDRLSA